MAKILVVDDSMFARLKICSILKGAGHETLEAGDGFAGVAMVEEHAPDCIVSDLLMPGLDGIGLLNSLRQRGSRLPVIFLTADIQQSKRQKCLELGAAGFLSKPPQQQELLGMVARTLDGGDEP